jgi:hypothetical protein
VGSITVIEPATEQVLREPPAELTPLTAFEFERTALEAGVPE